MLPRMRRRGEVERLDATLASLAVGEAGLRLRLGQVLEVLGRGKHFELGFSSVAAYALERCDRSVRWVEAARCLARRLEPLPQLRRAVALGRVSWSMGELLARVAQPADEAGWIAAARGRTVREMRVRTMERRGLEAISSEHAGLPRSVASRPIHELTDELTRDIDDEAMGGEAEDGDDRCTLTCTVNCEDAWLFEATRALLVQLGVYDADAQLEALLAEGQGALLSAVPSGELNLEALETEISREQARLLRLSRWRSEAEALCEPNFRRSMLAAGHESDGARAERDDVAAAAAIGLASLEVAGCRALDAQVRGLSGSLARHELELSSVALQFHRADGWRRLGYASEAQYARERLGLSRSSLLARRGLALRLEKLPRVARALGAGQIGVEAAMQVVRVATPTTEAAWVERAQQRTLKHLREEVAAALVAVRWAGDPDCPPPTDGEMTAFHELERAVVSGRVWQERPANDSTAPHDASCGLESEAEGASDINTEHELRNEVGADTRCDATAGAGGARGLAPRRAWRVMLGSLAAWLAGAVQVSAGRATAPSVDVRSKGRIELRLRVSRANYSWWRGLEERASRWLPSGTSWIAFLCHAVWSAWSHLLDEKVAYAPIYIRDRYRCSSPVCNRRDVTPHHLQLRSAGGTDHAHNVTSVCTWCHLFGVHGGRIRAIGTAERIRWEFGAPGSPCVIVEGRDRVAA